METFRKRVVIRVGLLAAISAGIAGAAFGQTVKEQKSSALPEGYSCSLCHLKEGELWKEGTPVAGERELANDIHWQNGLRCHDCHGGSASLDGFKNHRDDPSFRSMRSRADVPRFCGHCHSNLDFMRQYAPSARTDQESEYWTSGHGRRLKASATSANPQVDKVVATCVDCHGGHNILAVKNPESPVYATRVAETCARCHSDENRMAGRNYHNRPVGHDQFDQWRAGVHGRALLEKGDLSAPACNDCHGNHGAMPPGTNSVANACGTCHGKIAKLFAETNMKHKFEEVGLPGCATCHGAHLTHHPTDEMLGMESGAVCFKCHNPENPQYGATVAGAATAKLIRTRLEQLKQEITDAERQVREAERLGMEVRGPQFDLRQAFDALTNARTQVHGFKPGPLEEAIGEGLTITASVRTRADEALGEHRSRRIWLATSLIPILLVVALLLKYIRTLGIPPAAEQRL